jgi:3alpha(or 20beta)-hydroxysteroid dehydrogenase
MGKLDGRVALITGGARGMGAAEARLFAEEGAQVAIADILDADGIALAKSLGDAAEYLHLDVSSEQDWEQTVERTVARYGAIDVLINNAGIAHFGPLLQTSTADYQRIIDVNQTGVFLGMRTVAPAMRKGGSIINISSIDGLTGTPGLVAYVASKFAVRGMTKVAALEFAHLGIRVNSIHPGAINTDMVNTPGMDSAGAVELLKSKIPMDRFADPVEIAKLALYLASTDSSYSTGSEFTADGGMLAGTYFPLG